MSGTVALREILLASDFTARSDRPLDRAALLAGETGARLAIAHVLERAKDAATPEEVRALEARLRADLPAGAAGAELVIDTGSAPEVLARIAAARGSGLIVTGVARYNSIGDYLLGTAVDHIVRHADVPVLVVRARPRGPYAKLLVVTDFSEVSRGALLFAAGLFPSAAIVLLHAFHVPFQGWLKSKDTGDDVREEHQGRMDAFLADAAIPPALRARIETVLDDGELNGVAMRAVARTGADLLVLGTRTRGEAAHAAAGSDAESLLSVAGIDVLMVRVGAAA